MCPFVCVVDHGVNEGLLVDEQYYEQVNEDQFRDPDPEGQYFDQDLPEGFEDGKFNPILLCMFCPSFINTIYWPVLKKLHMFCLLKIWLDSHPLDLL